MMHKYAKKLPAEWADISDIFTALGDTTRQRILLLFEQNEEINIKDIASVFSTSRTSVTYHLTTLERAGLITRRREGRDVMYSFNKLHLISVLDRVLAYAKKEV